jgi:hypothetical protein
MPGKRKSVSLRSIRGENGSLNVWAELAENRSLVIQGQDLGRGVSDFYGPDLAEYEWAWVIKKADLPGLVTALGGFPGDDVLALLLSRFSGDGAAGLSDFLVAQAIPVERWSRIGS